MTSLLVPLLSALLLWNPPLAAAQEASSSSAMLDAASLCTREVGNALNRERFLYESVLFGLRAAEKEAVNATRVDEAGIVWIKTGYDAWATAGSRDKRTNDEMDRATARDTSSPAPDTSEGDAGSSSSFGYAGLLQTQQALTSDILPPIIQSFRAFQCRTAAVCQAANVALSRPVGLDEDLEVDENDRLTIPVPGCMPIKEPLFTHCQPNPIFTINDTVALYGFCEPTAKQLVSYHEEQLTFLAHYDAAHRTLRQFAGFLEPVLDVVSFPFLTPIRQASDFLGWWSRVPCFQPFCVQQEE